VTAVNDLSFTVSPGKVYGFLGPNGAGKTTTMNIITGYIAATSGSVTINGYDIYKDAKKAKRCIGYLPEQPPLYNELTPYEYLKVSAGLKEIPKGDRRRQIEEVMELTGISDVSNRLIQHLSKGYRQRVGLAQAILGYPDIIILDEPTVGLDPKQIIEIRDLISSLREKHTVILSSHILSEVSAICDTVMIISKGRLVASDTPDNLSAMTAGKNVVSVTVLGEREKIEQALAGVCAGTAVTITPSQEPGAFDAKVESGDEDLRSAIAMALSEQKLPILAMNKVTMSLEEVFLEVTSKSEEEDNGQPEEEEYEIIEEDEDEDGEDEDDEDVDDGDGGDDEDDEDEDDGDEEGKGDK
jgi:ABC-2 type transport system ATP-binding protein